MLRIWGRANSSNVMKVMWLVEELGLEAERIDAGGAFGRTQEPAYLAMNPNALVPVLEEDGFTLWESNAILRYLARTRPGGAAFLPAEPRALADMERWMDWQIASLNAPMTTVFFTYVRIPEPERDYAATARARDAAETLWAMVEARLAAGGPYLCGGALTLADVALGPYLHRWFQLPIARGPMPALEAWYGRLKARPGYAKWCAVKMT